MPTSGRRAAVITALALIAVEANIGVAFALRSVATSSRQPTRLACPATTLAVAMGPQVVPFTGEHAIVIVITNNGHKTCLLGGYPAVVIRTGKRALRFTYDDGGGPYLANTEPKVLTVRPGDHAAFLLAKYRCDVGEIATGTSIDIWLPGVPGRKTLRLTGEGVGMLAFCRKAKPNEPPDPGNTVAISPIESGRYAH